MTKLTDEQLQYEYDLSYEVLHDIYSDNPPYNGGVAIVGLLKQDPDKSGVGREQFLEALSVWKRRLERATDELERRFLLS